MPESAFKNFNSLGVTRTQYSTPYNIRTIRVLRIIHIVYRSMAGGCLYLFVTFTYILLMIKVMIGLMYGFWCVYMHILRHIYI